MSCKNLYSTVLILFVLFLYSAPALGKQADHRASLALLPLEQIAEKNISPLRRGLKNMIISRLAKRAEIKIISLCLSCPLPADSNGMAKRAQEFMKEYNTDYLLAGKLTEGKDHFVVETTIYARGVNKPIHIFSQEFANDDMISAVDKISWDIAEKIFGSHKPTIRGKKPAPSQPMPVPEPVAPSFQSAHPDRALKKTVIIKDLPELPPIKPYKSFALPPAAGLTKSPVQPQHLQEETISPHVEENKSAPAEITTSDLTETSNTEKINLAMQTMDIGDLDGDGRLDVIVSDNNRLMAYHLENAELRKFALQPRKASGQIISVQLADLNKNGREEIYVSCIVDGAADSFGLEWSGEKFTYLFKNEKWFVTPFNMPGKGIILAGQQSGKNKLFIPGIFRLQIISQVIQQREKIGADNTNLYNFSLADLDGNGSNEIIVLEQDHNLVIKNETGRLWQSSETFGDTISVKINNDKFIEIPARIMIADINNDKLPEIIIKQNMSADSNDIDGPDDFLRGSIQAFSWDGSSLNKIWQSEAVEGYIGGYRFFPATKTHPAQLYAGIVTRTGILDFFSNQDSLILIYPVIFK